jgi:hypothetical protein
MLTTAEEDRLEAALPTTAISIGYDGAVYDYDLDVHWSGGDNTGDDAGGSPDYPALVFGWDSQNDPRPERQPANNLDSVDNPAGEAGLTETEVQEVSDDLSMTVAVRATHDDNGVPPQVRATNLTRALWRAVEHDLDINSEGPNGERPIRPETTASPTPSRVERTYRYTWTVRLHHAERFVTDYPTAESADYSADSTSN